MGLVAEQVPEFHSSSAGEDMNINVLILLIVASVVVDGGLPPRMLAPLSPAPAPVPEPAVVIETRKPVMNKWGIIRGCRCRPPYYYDPVCGTDDQTYNNKETLLCARKCGYDVEIKVEGQCPE